MHRFILPFSLFLLDSIFMIGIIWLSATIRFSLLPYEALMKYATSTFFEFPLLLSSALICYLGFHLYTRIWKYIDLKDVMDILFANLCGAFIYFLIAMLFVGKTLPRSIFIVVFTCMAIFQVLSRYFLSQIYWNFSKGNDTQNNDNKVLIVGAGNAGYLLAQDILQTNAPISKSLVGFIDDDLDKKGKRLLGFKVLGDRFAIPKVVATLHVQEIYIAIPSLEQKKLREIADLCNKTGCKVKILPDFLRYLNTNTLSIKELRPLNIEDFLGRNSVELDIEQIGSYLTNKVILVTGAGGSIGSEICRQILRFDPQKILLLGRGENSIYEIHQELSKRCMPSQIVPLIANITDKDKLEKIFATYQPQVVFHAAAHKHVPLMEHQPEEAVYNNVYGSYNVGYLAGKYHCKRLVLISTDKAVNPTSVMGATKRLSEMIMQALNTQYPQTNYVAVRFGNVLGSRGSVVPLFKKQIEAGGPITITDPKMKRYFMTIPEASQLVLAAAALGNGGEVFVLNMGEPVSILDLAYQMILLSGLTPNKDIHIQFTGLRPGEKLFEELLSAEDGTQATENEKILKALIKEPDKNFFWDKINALIACKDDDQILILLKELIPTYKPNHF